MTRISQVARAAAGLGLALLFGCDSQLKENASLQINDIITSVTDASGSIHATRVKGPRPSAAGGPGATVLGIGVMINGGGAQQTVSAGSAFTTVIVAVQGADDYYELTLPAGVASQGLLLTANRRAPAGNFQLLYAVDDGNVGAYASQAVKFLQAATGDIQVSVSWTGASDVDLHVIDPNGDEVQFPAPGTVASGGFLDIDSNPACSLDNKNNENIVWPTGKAIAGSYTVIVDYWSDCGVPQSDYVVTVQRKGAQPLMFTGSFVGTAGGVPDDTVTVFTY